MAGNSVEDVIFQLDRAIQENRLTELHTHLMGLGSADFWVNRVMEVYLKNLARNGKDPVDVRYSIEDICIASNILLPSYLADKAPNEQLSWLLANVEAKLFSGILKAISSDTFQYDEDKQMYYMKNSTLVELLRWESENKPEGQRTLRANVRNWFEFLDIDGSTPSYGDILSTYRGNFTPQFYPRRFKMRKVICKQCPEVLGILLNNVLYRYAKAGVQYIEFSLNAGDLLDVDKVKFLLDGVFTQPYRKDLSVIVDKDDEDRDDEHPSTLGKRTSSGKLSRNNTATLSRLPTLPKLSTGSVKPNWRKYLNDYYPKSSRQTWAFLASFNRSDIRFPRFSQTGQLVFPQTVTTSETAQSDMFNLVDNLPRILAFLRDQGTILTDEDLAVLHLPDEEITDEQLLYLFAKVLCDDVYLEAMYEDIIRAESTLNTFFHKFHERESIFKDYTLAHYVVGIDWVGDEYCYPFCVFPHKLVLAAINNARKNINPNFGVRIHAGEGLIRYSSIAKSDDKSLVGRVFKFHLFCLMESIQRIYEGLAKSMVQPNKPNIRIGHGIAFLFTPREENSLLAEKLENFRQFLREKQVVCELNPTSNHMLIPSTFEGDALQNTNRSLSAFLANKIPVVLCTDDDGVWAIRKCRQHYHHISVAYEYCQAIEREEISDDAVLQQLIDNGRQFAFCAPPPN